jgi:aryl-alcohol dehydrogenase-like predicted oxidoreductase
MKAASQNRRKFLKTGGAATSALLAQSALAEAPSTEALRPQTGNMPTRNLGKTGHKVALFSLGGQAALEQNDNEGVAVPIIERALNLGVNYIDTSSIYGGPSRPSEQYIGQVMKRRRRETFLATKTKERSRDGSMRMIEESLRLLQTDHVDVWQLHDIGTMTDVEQVFAKGGAMEALLQARDQKMVRFLGITGHHRPDSLMECIRRYPFDNVLMGLNAADKHEHSFTDELLPLAVEKQMGIVGMKIPARGRLLASWTPPPIERQQRMWEGGANVTTRPGTLNMREAVYYAWSQPVSTVIIGIDSLEQLEENVALAREFTPLSEQQIAALHEKTAPVAEQALWFRRFSRG